MKRFLAALLLACSLAAHGQPVVAGKPPGYMLGAFEDDYQIKYQITDSLWLQLPNTRFHIIKWNPEKRYLIAKNDPKNLGEVGLYTRIDYMVFNNMQPWKWGYCLTAYSAATDAIAEATAAADREHPTTGCGGYPFSRMKRR